MNNAEHIYWLFTASAQTVAAFVAFVLAGYALVHSMMDSAAQSDETLVEIHESLKQGYHRRLTFVVVITGGAILLSLAVVFFNRWDTNWVPYLAGLAGLLVTVSIVSAVGFVIVVIDPSKYAKTAKRLAKEVGDIPGSPSAPIADFVAGFIGVEQMVRSLWKRRAHEARLSRRPGPPSFREMLEALALAEFLPRDLHSRLLNLSKYRNLVFHGVLEHIDRERMIELEQTRQELLKLLEQQ